MEISYRVVCESEVTQIMENAHSFHTISPKITALFTVKESKEMGHSTIRPR